MTLTFKQDGFEDSAPAAAGTIAGVSRSTDESRGITDYRDYPLLPGEKVGRHRFMSFFLENSTNHCHDFFNYAVDPEWEHI